MCSKAIDLRETLRAVLAHRAAQVPDRERPPPLVHTDECLDHPKVKETVAYLCGVGLAAGCDSLWLTKRVRPNGEPFYVWGGYKALRAIESFRGLPAKYFSWSDEQVLHVLLGKFLGSDHLVLLTANSRLDQRGLRKLLLEEIRPELTNGHRGRFRLHVLMKKGKSSVDEYCRGVVETLKTSADDPGFFETKI